MDRLGIFAFYMPRRLQLWLARKFGARTKCGERDAWMVGAKTIIFEPY
jgi:hypothetical protein